MNTALLLVAGLILSQLCQASKLKDPGKYRKKVLVLTTTVGILIIQLPVQFVKQQVSTLRKPD